MTKKTKVPDTLVRPNSDAVSMLHPADSADKRQDTEYIEYLANLVEFSDDAIISKSLSGIIKSWNKGSERMFGYTAGQAIGRHISLIIPEEYSVDEQNIVDKINRNEVIAHFETVRVKKNGEQLYVSLSVSPLKDKAGNIIGISKIARDISIRKKSEKDLLIANNALAFQNKEKEKRAAELIVANTELLFQNAEKEKRAVELTVANNELAFQNGEKEKQKAELIKSNYELKISREQILEVNKEMESFSYSVSHDLRAPLRAIHGYSKMLKENFEKLLDPEVSRLTNNIMNNAKRMGQLIDDLLHFSRISRKELVKVKVDMDILVAGLCIDFKNENSDRNIEFVTGRLSPALADAITIKNVWLNLISNAVKYTSLKKHSLIKIGSEIRGDEIVYYIKDNGAGFDMRYADKLFGVFQRLHSDEEFEGTGVGLALVQRILTKHGGKIWAEAVVDEGATFFFTLKTIPS
ncbi:MAG: PAS domain S-box protein [Chitinophagaceae bacterium]